MSCVYSEQPGTSDRNVLLKSVRDKMEDSFRAAASRKAVESHGAFGNRGYRVESYNSNEQVTYTALIIYCFIDFAVFKNRLLWLLGYLHYVVSFIFDIISLLYLSYTRFSGFLARCRHVIVQYCVLALVW